VVPKGEVTLSTTAARFPGIRLLKTRTEENTDQRLLVSDEEQSSIPDDGVSEPHLERVYLASPSRCWQILFVEDLSGILVARDGKQDLQKMRSKFFWSEFPLSNRKRLVRLLSSGI